MIKICHVITGLSAGGAESALHRLIAAMDPSRFSTEVLSLTDKGPVAARIEALGVPVRALGMRRGAPDPRGFFRLRRHLAQARPDLVQTWMYHADLLGALAAPRVPVLWHIVQTNLDPALLGRGTFWTARICAWLSRRLPKKILVNSEAGRRSHADFGYAPDKLEVVRNGFDTRVFRPDPAAYAAVRRELGIPPEGLVAGLVARWDPYKGHDIFVRAAAETAKACPGVTFVLYGDGVTADNRTLAQWIGLTGHADRFRLLGRREDVARLTAALDVACSSSVGEGFPNAVGEAMSCAVPCVVTDVGDSAFLVAETGRVVPARDAGALASAMIDLLSRQEERGLLGAAARRRIESMFSIQAAAARYEEIYMEALSTGSSPLRGLP